jgi:hypothetical protein
MRSILIDLGFLLIVTGVIYLKLKGINTVIDDILATIVGFYVGTKVAQWKE